MPLPALAVFRLLFPLQLALFAQSVTDVPQVNPGVGSNSGAAAGSLTSGSNAPLVSPQPGNLSLTGSVLPNVSAPKAAQPKASVAIDAVGVQSQAPARVLTAPENVSAEVPQGPVGLKAERPAATAKQQLEGFSKKAGEISQMLREPGSEKNTENAGAKASALFEGARKPTLNAVEVPGAGAAQVGKALPGLARSAHSAEKSPLDILSSALPADFKALARRIVDALKKPSALAQKSKVAYQRGDAASIARMQNAFKNALLSKAKEAVQARGLPEGRVISHGTTLKGLLGMIFSDGLEATSSYRGFSGESAAFWGAWGVDVGASYGATRGVSKGQPGVAILVFNPQDPIKIVQGETMSRRPTVSADFIAAVVTDGERAVVLDQAALRGLAASAKAWKDAAVKEAHQGRMREFTEWESLRSALEPGER
ncbi:MAG: hypothetical protein HY922_00795 [Elusimicrobia bacterium]|nr:hypothetical protein [Elusimicrobiota bacterium]